MAPLDLPFPRSAVPPPMIPLRSHTSQRAVVLVRGLTDRPTSSDRPIINCSVVTQAKKIVHAASLHVRGGRPQSNSLFIKLHS